MWPFSLLRKPLTLDDAVFGTIVYRRRAESWGGTLRLNGCVDPVEVTIQADESGPTESQRRIAMEFAGRFTEIEDEMQEALWKHYLELRDDHGWDFLPDFETPQTLWDSCGPYRLGFFPDSIPSWPGLEVSVEFGCSWDGEHGLWIAIGDGHVLEIMIE